MAAGASTAGRAVAGSLADADGPAAVSAVDVYASVVLVACTAGARAVDRHGPALAYLLLDATAGAGDGAWAYSLGHVGPVVSGSAAPRNCYSSCRGLLVQRTSGAAQFRCQRLLLPPPRRAFAWADVVMPVAAICLSWQEPSAPAPMHLGTSLV